MKRRLLLAGLSIGMGLATFAVSTSALAAAQPPCVPATMIPGATTVPANIPAFGYNALKATSQDVHLYALSSGKQELPLTVGPVAGGILPVKPNADLTPGTSYELDYNAFCTYGAFPTTPLMFTAGPSAPIPTKLGDLSSAPSVVLKDFGTTQYTISANLALTDEMKPWVGVYQLYIVLDGKQVASTAIASGQRALLINGVGWCDGTNASTNKHSVIVRGTLPASPNLETTSTELDFTCPAPAFGPLPTNPPGTAPNGSSGGASSSSGASGGGGTSGGDNGGSSKGASGCTMSHSRSTSFAGIAGVAVGLAALLRRRSKE
jgi:uncharacterized membrane protein YgcG